ncbi:MAG: alpha/beta fold hydrolase [Patescibacteria group bacterium]
MAQPHNHRGRESILIGRSDASRVVILFHGYTGSPAEFGSLPDLIAERLDAQVLVPLLPGHGTTEEDLLPFEFDDFLRAAEETMKYAKESGRPYAIGGHSFGGHLAFLMAAKHEPVALFATALPYELRYWLRLPIVWLLAWWYPFWEKRLTADELEARKGYFYYTKMPSKGLRIVHEGNRYLNKIARDIASSVLMIHAKRDRIAYARGVHSLLAKTQALKKNYIIIESERHSMFYGLGQDHVVDSIMKFLEGAFKKYE